MLHYYDDTYEETAARLPSSSSPLTAIQILIGESCRFTCEIIGVDLIRVLYIQQLHKNPEEQEEMDYHRPLYQLFKHFFEQGQEQKDLSPQVDLSHNDYLADSCHQRGIL